MKVRAVVIDGPGRLRITERETPSIGGGQVRIRVHACGICRTDLHILDGDLPHPGRPLVPGHQVIGVVEEVAADVASPCVGDRVGVPWLGWTCGVCRYCTSGRENLCAEARFTGYGIDGGLADACVADARFCLPVPDGYPDEQAAPLLCAGLVGHRALRMTGEARTLGLYGFGAAAHIVAQVARFEGRRVFAFTRPGDGSRQDFARTLGAEWAGGSDEDPPETLDAAILFAAAGELVPRALRCVARGGTVVCAEIHMTDIPSFAYELLWGERVVRSVANLTRRDGAEFLTLAPRVPIRTEVESFPFERTADALEALREGRVRGAAVVTLR